MKNNPFDFLRDQLESHLPPAAQPLHDKIRGFSKRFAGNYGESDWVPRVVFDEQAAALSEAQERLRQLEMRINQLERNAK